MILQMTFGEERVNTIIKNQPEQRQHFLNYCRIDRLASRRSRSFLPKNSLSLGEFFFSGPTGPPLAPYVWHLRPVDYHSGLRYLKF